jgi:hypothetical protein
VDYLTFETEEQKLAFVAVGSAAIAYEIERNEGNRDALFDRVREYLALDDTDREDENGD